MFFANFTTFCGLSYHNESAIKTFNRRTWRSLFESEKVLQIDNSWRERRKNIERERERGTDKRKLKPNSLRATTNEFQKSFLFLCYQSMAKEL